MIYFIERPCDGLIKIGTTIRFGQRLANLIYKHGHGLKVLAVVKGNQQKEKDFHRRFKHLRMVDEWFYPGDDLVKFIAREGTAWKDRGEATVRIDPDLATMSKYVAAQKGTTVAEYLSSILRPTIDREFRDAAPKLKG